VYGSQLEASIRGSSQVSAKRDKEHSVPRHKNWVAQQLTTLAQHAQLPPSIRIISVPSVLRLAPQHIDLAFQLGADGVFIGQGFEAESCGEDFESVETRSTILSKKLYSAGSIRATKDYRVYIPHFVGLHKRLMQFDGKIKETGEMEAELAAP